MTTSSAVTKSADPPWYTAEFAAAPLVVDFFAREMFQITTIMGVTASDERLDAMFLEFERDDWTNSEFRCACIDLKQTLRGFPYYADFYAVRG